MKGVRIRETRVILLSGGFDLLVVIECDRGNLKEIFFKKSIFQLQVCLKFYFSVILVEWKVSFIFCWCIQLVLKRVCD